MNVLLINPPSPYLQNDASYPPSGLMYLASSIRGVHDVRIMDLSGGYPMNDGYIDWADVYGITCTTPNVNMVNNLISKLPQNKPIMVGGHHPTHLPNSFDERAIVVCGEAEMVIHEVLHDIKMNNCKRFYRQKYFTPINHVPLPARDLVDLNRYSPGGWKGSTVIYTSRGCPYNCNFCSKIGMPRFWDMDESRVLWEIHECKSLGFNRIVFGDDNIIVKSKRLMDLLRKIKHMNIEFRLNQDSRHLSDGMAEMMADAGCAEISFGIESGSQRILDGMNKQNTVEMNENSITIAKKHGITTKAYFMVNYPGEDDESIQETIEFASRARPDKWLLSNFCPLPGSIIYRKPTEYGITWMSDNWSDYYLVGKDGSFQPCFEAHGLSKEQQVHNYHYLYDELKKAIG